MNIVCLDMEGVLVPEIWIAFAEASGIPELKRTTRDEPDYNKLMNWRLGILKEHGLSQEELAAALSMSPSALANRLRLLRLSVEARAFIRESGLSERHARALLKLEDGAQQLQFARLAAKSRWSVRQLEAQIAHNLNAAPTAKSEVRLIRDNRLVINALNDTVRQLKRIGVHASSRVEAHEDSYDVIITVRRPYDADA